MDKKIVTEFGGISYFVLRERRKSISLKFRNASLIVQIPKYSLVNVEDLLSQHMDWIVKHYIEISNSKNLLKGHEILLNGVYHKMEFVPKAGHSRVTKIENRILIESENRYKGTMAALKFARQMTEDIIRPMVEAKLVQTSKSVSEVKFRRMKKWGYCTSDGKIRFNAYLSMAPLEVMEYVVSHEVSHLTQMNHSKRFWKVVESLSPNYKQLKKELKKHNINEAEELAKISEIGSL